MEHFGHAHTGCVSPVGSCKTVHYFFIKSFALGSGDAACCYQLFNCGVNRVSHTILNCTMFHLCNVVITFQPNIAVRKWLCFCFTVVRLCCFLLFADQQDGVTLLCTALWKSSGCPQVTVVHRPIKLCLSTLNCRGVKCQKKNKKLKDIISLFLFTRNFWNAETKCNALTVSQLASVCIF